MSKYSFYLVASGLALSLVTIVTLYVRKHNESKKRKKKKLYLSCRTLSDFEEMARGSMFFHRFYYYNYKAGKGHTYEACRNFFDTKLRIIPRVLIDVGDVSINVKILGHIYESPIIIAPTTFHCLADIDGELSTARGATAAQCIYTYNWMYSTKPEYEVLETKGPKFLHIYLTSPTEILEKVVSEANQKGYRALVITCDHPTDRVRDQVLPMFEEASKNFDFELTQSMSMPNMNVPDIIAKQNFTTGTVTWENIRWIKSLTKLPIICKGIIATVDAELAIKYGADAIIVSNHGGRQVDTAPPAIECLEDIVDVVNGRIEVYVDSGIRSGTDVLKALALGAKAVFIGRPILYGLACGGEPGVQRVLEILKQELKYDMACCGLTSLDGISENILYKHHRNPKLK